MNRRNGRPWKPLVLGLVFVLVGAGIGVHAGARTAADERLIPADGSVEGRSFGEWTARWWQWADAQPVAPYLDPDGRLCALGQEGPVWFLAGTDGSFSAERQCVVPEGRYLLLPVINMLYMSATDAAVTDRARCEPLQLVAGVNNDHLASAAVLIDGVPVSDVKQYRVRSDGCFRLDGVAAAADGYWLLLKPLPRGRHVIAVGANYAGDPQRGYGTMNQNFEYVIHVGAPTSLAVRGRPARTHRRAGPVAGTGEGV